METSKKYLLQTLIHLGKLDQDFDEREQMVVKRIARLNGVDESVVEEMMRSSRFHDKEVDVGSLSYEEKFDTLYQLVLLMKADNQILNSEVLFIQKVANNLGFQIGAIMELYPHVHFNMVIPEKMKVLRKRLKDFLVEKEKTGG